MFIDRTGTVLHQIRSQMPHLRVLPLQILFHLFFLGHKLFCEFSQVLKPLVNHPGSRLAVDIEIEQSPKYRNYCHRNHPDQLKIRVSPAVEKMQKYKHTQDNKSCIYIKTVISQPDKTGDDQRKLNQKGKDHDQRSAENNGLNTFQPFLFHLLRLHFLPSFCHASPASFRKSSSDRMGIPKSLPSYSWRRRMWYHC